MTDRTRRAETAERAARAGGAVAIEQFRGSPAVDTKASPTDLVTDADRATQRAVIADIREAFPGATLVCEEESTPADSGMTLATTLPDSGPAWVVDPIDGTANYVRGMRSWATVVAALVDGDPVGAATFLPAVDDCYTVGPDGVSLNGRSVSVSDRTRPAAFTVGLIGRVTGRTAPCELFRAGSALGSVRRLGSMQAELALVAAGSLDAALTLSSPPPWDTIAGVALVRRAGGVATDIHGDRWEHGATGLVVSNGETHGTILEVAQAGMAD